MTAEEWAAAEAAGVDPVRPPDALSPRRASLLDKVERVAELGPSHLEALERWLDERLGGL